MSNDCSGSSQNVPNVVEVLRHGVIVVNRQISCQKSSADGRHALTNEKVTMGDIE